MTNFQLIPNKEIIPLFIDICPELRKAWEEHLEYWGSDERGDYNDISVLAHFIVDSYKQGQTEPGLSGSDQVNQLIIRQKDTKNGLR